MVPMPETPDGGPGLEYGAVRQFFERADALVVSRHYPEEESAVWFVKHANFLPSPYFWMQMPCDLKLLILL